MAYLLIIVIGAVVGFVAGQYLKGSEHGSGVDALEGAVGGFLAVLLSRIVLPAATAGWNVTYSWPGSQAISQIWSATETQTGAAVTVTNASYNGALPPGGSTTFGFLGTGSVPTSLTNLRCTAR